MGTPTTIEPDGWTDAIEMVEGPQLVVGGPGSGKTEFLVRRARHLLESNACRAEELVVLSFGRRGVADLRARISDGLGSISRVPAMTFHSLAMRIIEAHGRLGDWDETPTVLTGPEQVHLVSELLRDEDPKAWAIPFRPILGEHSFGQEVADFILRSAERLETPESIDARGRADWKGLPPFLERYRRELIRRSRIDYGSLQAEAVRLLEIDSIRRSLGDAIRFVLVDEYQDTTVAQAGLLEALAETSGNLTVAGDPYQSIYGFRGAELHNIDEFTSRFVTEDGSPAHHLVLTTSFRVPSVILDAAVRVTAGGGLTSGGGPMEPATHAGSVETYGFDQQSNEADWIAGEIQRLHLRDRVPLERIAVLVRTKRRFLSELSRALERRSIPHDRPDARLVDHRAVRPILDLARAASAETSEERSTAVRRVLLGPFGRLTLSGVREIERAALRRGWDTTLQGVDLDPALRSLLVDAAWATDQPAHLGFWHLWTNLDVFADIVHSSDRTSERQALASFSQALTRLAERDPSVSLADYAELSEAEEFEATPLLEYRGRSGRVTLTTLHQAKGLTFDVVFIADAREGVLPDLRSRDSLLGARHLAAVERGDRRYADHRLREEMRLVYSAMCRAAQRVVWTCTTTGFDGGEGVPSRFIPIVAGRSLEEATRPPVPWRDPTTPIEAEAWLRRRQRAPDLPLADRLAATTHLVVGSEWQPRDPATFAGALEPGPDTGLTERTRPLSASDAEAYDRCPRRFVFERRLRVDGGGSGYQELGLVIHSALERAESMALERGDDHATLDEALTSLEDAFQADAFGDEAWAEAWLARGRRILTHLYEHWPGAGPAIGLEEAFEIELGGTTWRGRVDRIEDRADGPHVVDYKTGTQTPTKSDAARSLQLGLYALATDAVGGEYWYPAKGAGQRASVAVVDLDPAQLDDVTERLSDIADQIGAEQWQPIPGGHCRRCPVRLVCPEWPEGRSAFSA